MSMDVSNNPLLDWFICNNNQMTSLNLENGNNANFILIHAINNPNLDPRLKPNGIGQMPWVHKAMNPDV